MNKKEMIDIRFCDRVVALTSVLVLVCLMLITQVYANNSWQPLPIGIVQRIAFGSCVRLDQLQAAKYFTEQKMTQCAEPRPEVCTMDYRPVCAQLEDGSFKTYSNGCTACTDRMVTAYNEGACKE